MSAKSSTTVNIAALSDEDRAILMAQLQEVSKDRQTQLVHTYGQELVTFATSVIANEQIAKSNKSDWVGYRVSGVPVTVEGHTFTVSVTLTDTEGKKKREEERLDTEAAARLAAKAAKEAAEDE